LLERDVALCAKGVAVTFIVHASRDEDTTTTIRLSVVVAIAKGRALAEEGWQVFTPGPTGSATILQSSINCCAIASRYTHASNLKHF
jgi:hypothetical protein